MSTLLDKLLRREAVRQSREAPIAPRTPGSHTPLAPVQMQLWLDAQLDPESPALNRTAVLEFTGPLARRDIERAMTTLAHRHEILRTAFPYIDGQVVQAVYDSPCHELPFHDLRGAGPQKLTRLENYDARRPFDTAVGPLWRARLFQLDGERRRLHLTFHELVCDAASLENVIAPEIVALSQGAELSEPAFQFADFALWQRKSVDNQAVSRQVDYWRARLQGAPTEPLNVPQRAEIETIAIPEATLAAVERAGQAQGVTPDMFLLAAFAVLLYRYTGQDDVCIALPHPSKGRDEFAGLAGNCTHTVALRAAVQGTSSVRHVLREVRDAVLAAEANGEAPFDQVARALKLGSDSIFPAAFLSAANSELAPGWTLQPGAPSGHARYPLELHLYSSQASFRYHTSRYEAALARRMGEHWLTLAAAMASQPDAAIGELPLLSRRETNTLAARGRGMVHPVPELPLHELFQAQAARTPRAIAVECDGVKLSYRELNQEANVLARRLKEEKIDAGEPVGLAVERSCDLIVALLAILKAGGAYTADWRSARVTLADRGAPQKRHGTTIVRCDESGGSDRNLGHTSRHDDVACLRGGVQIEHRTIVNAVLSWHNEIGFGEHDSMLAAVPLDAAVAIDVFLPLLTGGRLVIAASGAWLMETIAESEVTTMQAPAPVWQALIDKGWAGDRNLIALSADPLPVGLADAMLDRVRELWISYGCPLPLTVRRIAGDEAATPGIGRPLDNTNLTVLDGDGNLVPDGAVGNLWVMGTGLGCGPRERFTGDRARWGAEDTLEIVASPVPPLPIQPRAPSGEMEQKLAEMFGGILHIASCPATASFFELGGHVLLAVKLARRMEHELGVRVSLREILEAPTVGQLAQIAGARGAKAIAKPVPVRTERRQLLWVYAGPQYRDLARQLGLTFRGVALDPVDQETLPRGSTLEQMAALLARHLRGHQPEGPYYLAGTGAYALLAYETAAQLESAGQRVATVLLVEPPAPQPPGWWSRLLSRRGRPAFERTLEEAARAYRLQPLAAPVAVFQAERRPLETDLRRVWSHAPVPFVEIVDVGGDSRRPESMYQPPYAVGLAASMRQVLDKQSATGGVGVRRQA